MDAVPLIDAQTANILGSVNKYTIQQHVKWWDNCIEAPNTYTIYNMATQQPLIRVEEQSDGCTRCFCAPHHSVVLQFNALDPSGNPIFPVITMEREGCCSKPCLGGCVCMDCCANEGYVHAGSVTGDAGKLPKDKVIGRAKVPIMGGGEGFFFFFSVTSRAVLNKLTMCSYSYKLWNNTQLYIVQLCVLHVSRSCFRFFLFFTCDTFTSFFFGVLSG